ncbi:DUF2336 domain-containing protein [Stakelama marina]|uniref:DUF2336 domain-containing protein n=1 Tax=Stakelama marina TaxID=2826939 RepID=A0A8T4IC27_9SPHN|nr:DUF2336 domain-containing protein [Stakelama marina]MBR0551384.1 DUF2336 domain-containing protein [Stakelama marina]
MSGRDVDMHGGAAKGANRLLASVAALTARARGREMAALRTVLRGDSAWLDDRRRWAVGMALRATVVAVEEEIRAVAVPQLLSIGEETLAERVETLPTVADRVISEDSESNRRVAAEVVAVTRLRLLGSAIPPQAPEHHDQPSLLARLAERDHMMVTPAAMALLKAEADADNGDGSGPVILPEPIRGPLVWRVAAAIRLAIRSSGKMEADALDLALCDGARRSIDNHSEDIDAEEAAMRLAATLEAAGESLVEMIDQSLADRRISLFTALLAWALRVEFSAIRDLIFDDMGNGLWVAMRAADLPRDMIARAAFLLSEAGSRHDIEALADTLDTLMEIAPDDARAALAHLTLDSEYRHALRALAPKWVGW